MRGPEEIMAEGELALMRRLLRQPTLERGTLWFILRHPALVSVLADARKAAEDALRNWQERCQKIIAHLQGCEPCREWYLDPTSDQSIRSEVSEWKYQGEDAKLVERFVCKATGTPITDK